LLALASSSKADDTVEKLLHGVYSLFAPNANATATGNDQDLYARINELQANPQFAALAGKVTLSLAIDAGLATQARTDFTAAAALLVLSPIAISANSPQGQTALDALWQTPAWSSIYQAWQADVTARQSAGTAMNFTDTYLNDRQALLQYLITANLKDAATNPDGYLAVQGTPRGDTNLRYIDIGSGAMLQINEANLSPSTASNRYVIFGNANDNPISGATQDDHLYAGAGADTLNGQAGNDYLEGGAGADTYQFTGSFGHDTVLDAGGQGTIRINTDTLDGGIKLTDTIWESADRKYIYVVVGADLIIGQRTTPGAATVTDTITVKNWHASELGLTPQTAATPAPAPQSHLTVYQDYSPAANNQGSVTEVVDGQTTSTPSGADYTVQRTTTTGQASVVYSGPASQYINADSWDQQITTDTGNDLVIAGQWELPAGAGDADIVNSGAGSDLVFTGQGRDIIDAGDGDDFIMSGGEATVASMQSEDPASQVPAGAAWVRAGHGQLGPVQRFGAGRPGRAAHALRHLHRAVLAGGGWHGGG
jgi:Ca2+-binding RTX toxin-like protein